MPVFFHFPLLRSGGQDLRDNKLPKVVLQKM